MTSPTLRNPTQPALPGEKTVSHLYDFQAVDLAALELYVMEHFGDITEEYHQECVHDRTKAQPSV